MESLLNPENRELNLAVRRVYMLKIIMPQIMRFWLKGQIQICKLCSVKLYVSM